MMTERGYQATAKIVIILFLLLQLAACGGGGGAGGDGDAIIKNVTQTIEGSVGDGPVIDATLNVYANDGTLVHTATSDSTARYTASLQVDDKQYPLTIEVKGGIDLVTRRAPDFKLLSVVTGPPPNGVININPYTTVAVEMARRMPGGLSSINVETANQIVLEQLNFGLDRELVPDPFHVDINANNVAIIIKASETLGEMLRRVHNSLYQIGLSADMDDTMSLLALDLVDGVLDGSVSDDVRVADIFTLVSSQVLTEAMRNELRVDGVNAASTLDDAIRQTQPSTPFSKLSDSVRINRTMLLQVQSVVGVAAKSTASNDLEELSSLLQTVEVGSYPADIDPAIADSGSNGLGEAMAGLLSQANVGTVPGSVEPAPVEKTTPPRNSVPQLSGSPSTTVNVGEVYRFQPSAVDSDGDGLTFSIQNRPIWCGFNENTGRLSGTPNPSDVGVNGNIIITVSDGLSNDVIGPFSIRVNEVTVGSPVEPVAERKYNTGHYISLLRKQSSQSIMLNSVKPGVVGFLKRYTWRELEPSLGQYDFSEIESDLALVASQGMQLVVKIEDKTFVNEKPLPAYLSTDQYSRANKAGGHTAVRWSPYFVTRLKALIKALGQRFDAHPNFEGIAPATETAPSLSNTTLDATGYTPEKYRDALIDVLTDATLSLPTSRVFWFMNFLPRNQSYIGDIANAVKSSGVVMGGPDLRPDDHSLLKNAYPFYDQFNGQLPMYRHVSGSSYDHPHKDTSYPTKYWTMDELFRYARDKTHLDYMFWVRLTLPTPSDSYVWEDALPVIANNPVFQP